ncbi:MAG: hypothetical protein Q7K40_00270 [bacterium]|nr:hypothetical protein [bacterium]
MEKFDNTSFESLDMKITLQKLEGYVSQGFLLHGSKNKIEVLEPRQAQDDNHDRKSGNLNAVYATDDIRISIFMALFAKKDADKNGWRAFYNSTNEDEMSVGGENVTFTPGYIHVLPGEKFRKVDDKNSKEIVAYEPVAPIDVVQVTPDIAAYLSGINYDIK